MQTHDNQIAGFDQHDELGTTYPKSTTWFLTIEMVAELLHCSVDHVRRIPCNVLPYSRPGKHNIYRFVDVDAYVCSIRISRADHSPTTRNLIESLADSVRERSSQKGRRYD